MFKPSILKIEIPKIIIVTVLKIEVEATTVLKDKPKLVTQRNIVKYEIFSCTEINAYSKEGYVQRWIRSSEPPWERYKYRNNNNSHIVQFVFFSLVCVIMCVNINKILLRYEVPYRCLYFDHKLNFLTTGTAKQYNTEQYKYIDR